MTTHVEDAEQVASRPEDDEDAAWLEQLRAAGVRLGNQNFDRPRVIGRARPNWLAFLLRIVTLRRREVDE
jgi:hypothetical protein